MHKNSDTAIRNTYNGAEAMLRMLEAYDVRHVFGLCGDTTLPFYDALYRLDHNIDHILARDERTAAYMADGYARASRRVGVCEGPSGGGATYILPGLIEANESSSAVLGITTDVSVSSYAKFPLTEVDQEALMRPLTKWNTVVKRADHIPRMMRRAFRNMTTGRPGSAHLGIPYDIQYDPVDVADIWADETHQSFPAWRAAPEPGAAQAVIDAILSAKRPLIVCGGGIVIADACAELDKLASRLDIAVATSISGQGSLSDLHPNCAGVVGSNGGTDESWELIQLADMVIFLGCRAGSTTTARWEAPGRKTRIVHIDSDPDTIGANYQTEVGVVADLRLALSEINRQLDADSNTIKRFGGAATVKEIKRRKFARFASLARCPDVPIRPEVLIAAMQKTLPSNTIVVSDPGTSCPYISAFLQSSEAGRRFITNRAHGALGYSLGAAIGAWFARPQNPVVAVMGDGSFGFSAGDLETLCRLNVPLMVIVISNASFGWIKASQHDDCGARYHNVDFSVTNHARIAAEYGLKSWRVTEPNDVADTLTLALAADGPTLVDVDCLALELSNAPVRRWMG